MTLQLRSTAVVATRSVSVQRRPGQVHWAAMSIRLMQDAQPRASRAPDRERHAAARLNVHEQDLAIGGERRARELFLCAIRDGVQRKVEDLTVRRDAAQEVLRRPVLAQRRALARADAEVVGRLEQGAAGRLEQQGERFRVRVVDPQLAEAVAVAGRGRFAGRRVAAPAWRRDLALVGDDAL